MSEVSVSDRILLLKCSLISAVQKMDLVNGLKTCKELSELDPHNLTVLEFQPLLNNMVEYVHGKSAGDSSSSGDESSSDVSDEELEGVTSASEVKN
jgi:hypothetical protein